MNFKCIFGQLINGSLVVKISKSGQSSDVFIYVPALRDDSPD